mmetsp:Transcript_29142/g.73261  ORF Transcript_29142/g.73261 Transcript_29142/m.73261 type:complete len:238 (+) Transcript_29142:76-789(+)|eukprot:CAMPEP_0174239386 /NCGR_PEP_ID=MMETSP0417-20130205/14408_1 /TAXON_ID=242541 /ORGANISM="Mayorella sp, Strain BSH-02190019" /LENGTH=237 /DNA_ID=CAMNT_0015318323 /DNA_START=59 /DNA_END=772 /DNA_ORIENTATION=+
MLSTGLRNVSRSVASSSLRASAAASSRQVHSSTPACSDPITTNQAVGTPDFSKVRAPATRAAEESRRAFSYFVLGAFGVTVASAAKQTVAGILDTLNPSADVLAMANVEFDLSSVELGKTSTIKWRGKPVFVRHRTADEIALAVADDGAADLRDVETDAERAYLDPKYLVVLGICTHLGCVPLSGKGDYKGWFCPCHGSHYDLSGRIRKGPAPLNLELPPYKYVEEGSSTILIGERE